MKFMLREAAALLTAGLVCVNATMVMIPDQVATQHQYAKLVRRTGDEHSGFERLQADFLDQVLRAEWYLVKLQKDHIPSNFPPGSQVGYVRDDGTAPGDTVVVMHPQSWHITAQVPKSSVIPFPGTAVSMQLECEGTRVNNVDENVVLSRNSIVHFHQLEPSLSSYAIVFTAQGMKVRVNANCLLPHGITLDSLKQAEQQVPPIPAEPIVTQEVKRKSIFGFKLGKSSKSGAVQDQEDSRSVLSSVSRTFSFSGKSRKDADANSVASKVSKKTLGEKIKNVFNRKKDQLSATEKLLTWRLQVGRDEQCADTPKAALESGFYLMDKKTKAMAQSQFECAVTLYQEDVTANEYEHVLSLVSLAAVLGSEHPLSRNLYLKSSVLIYQRSKYLDVDGHDFSKTVRAVAKYGQRLAADVSNHFEASDVQEIAKGFADAFLYLSTEKDVTLKDLVAETSNVVASEMGNIRALFRLAELYILRESSPSHTKLDDYKEALEMLNEVSLKDPMAVECPHLWFYQAYCLDMLSDTYDSPIAAVYDESREIIQDYSIQDIYLKWHDKMKPLSRPERDLNQLQMKTWNTIKKIKKQQQ